LDSKLGLTPASESGAGTPDLRTDVEELLALAERLKEAHGGELDDSAIQAVAEMTNAPVEYVRLAVLSREKKTEKKQTGIQKSKTFLLSLDPATRTYVYAAIAATIGGLFRVIADTSSDPSGLFGTIVVLAWVAAAGVCGLAKDRKLGVLCGAAFGAMFSFSSSVFLAIFQAFSAHAPRNGDPTLIIPFTMLGTFVGLFANAAWQKHSRKIGVVDPAEERRQLLSKLVELQDQLRAGEQTMSFLSLDIVGSTRLKEFADPLAVEFTFTEYHRFVESITRKHGGSVHSTAGDGITCAFPNPAAAFAAARNIQSGLIEVNTYRNKLGSPLVLRAGIHHGAVVPQGDGIQSISFAHVIDIAAHIQKECPEGAVAVSLPAASMIQGGPSIVGDEEVSTHNVTARVWRPKRSSDGAQAQSTPPKFQPEV